MCSSESDPFSPRRPIRPRVSPVESATFATSLLPDSSSKDRRDSNLGFQSSSVKRKEWRRTGRLESEGGRRSGGGGAGDSSRPWRITSRPIATCTPLSSTCRLRICRRHLPPALLPPQVSYFSCFLPLSALKI